jgi:hypothetical protein
MGYKVRVQWGHGGKRGRLVRYYGTGVEGEGIAYKTKESAEKRATNLKKDFPPKKSFSVKVIRV